MLLELLLQRSINKLTVNDFNFDIGTSIGTINPQEIEIIKTKKKLDDTVAYTVKIPCVNSFLVNNQGMLKRPTIQEITLLDLGEYKKYKEKNDKYDCVEVKIFYIGAELKNKRLLDEINNYIDCHNIRKYAIQKDKVPYIFLYCNWNIPPFITEEKQFTEDDKQRLFENIKALLLRAIR